MPSGTHMKTGSCGVLLPNPLSQDLIKPSSKGSYSQTMRREEPTAMQQQHSSKNQRQHYGRLKLSQGDLTTNYQH